MKTQFKFHLLAAAFLFTGSVAVAGWQGDPREEVPGDNFSLEGALELFKKSASPQEFEQLLNTPSTKVNNLDLNGDGDIDYVRVIDRADGNIHTFTLQALVSNNEAQDIAVIELEKRNDGTAVLQIVGDADIYGIETIIEPTQEVRVNAGTTTARTVVNVWTWPSVQYVYAPMYNPWISPWSWSYYPVWYRPWRPVAYYVYDPWWRPYRPYYSVCYSHRVMYAPRIYSPYRSTSVIVYNRHSSQISQFRSTRGDSYARSGNHRYNRYDNETRYRSNQGHSNNSYNNSDRRSDDNNSRTRSYSNGNSRRSFNNNESSGNTVTRQRSATRSDFSNPSNSGRQRSFSTPNNDGGGRQRSFSTPNSNGNNNSGGRQRSFSAPSNGGGGGGGHQRSFSAPSDGGGGGRSHGSPAPSGGGAGGGGGGHQRGRH